MNNIEQKLKELEIKKAKHKQFSLLMKLAMLTKKHQIIGDLTNKEPGLLVFNHLGYEDFPTTVLGAKVHFNLIASDVVKDTFSGKIFERNGVTWATRGNKKQNMEVKEETVELLKHSIWNATCPEATWNLSPNLLLLPLRKGSFEDVQEANRSIYATVNYITSSKTITKNLGPIEPSSDVMKTTEEMKEKMATAYYNSMEEYYKSKKHSFKVHKKIIDGETYYFEKRENINPDYWDKFVANQLSKDKEAAKNIPKKREYESQFIYEPKEQDYFIIHNSSIKEDENGNITIKRISSEKNGYYIKNHDRFFGYGYNEVKYKQKLKELTVSTNKGKIK